MTTYEVTFYVISESQRMPLVNYPRHTARVDALHKGKAISRVLREARTRWQRGGTKVRLRSCEPLT